MSNEELVKEIQQGINSRDNLEKLYDQNSGVIHKMAVRYSKFAEIEDLMQEAYFGIYEAAQKYRSDHEVLFITYATFWIQSAMKRYIENNGKNIRIPTRLQAKVYEYKKFISSYKRQSNKEPTDIEICEALNIKSKALKTVRQTIQEVNDLDSLDRDVVSEDGGMSLVDSIPDSVNIEDDVINRIMETDLKTQLWKIVESNVTERENKVILDRYKGNMTLAAIGMSFGVTREGIRQTELKAMRKLRTVGVSKDISEKFEVNYARAYGGSVSGFKRDWTSSTERAALGNLEIERLMYS
ncbi:sigma-70 family RNA polymerase sigma factor [[Clostridium] fimetarium]|uniref:RNA polymerase primary sigma factor n=1 Tax=[Clostridium] fimetarium TaxID=99656 RepID=A0A1I0M0C1_9FIRM|nr:sigma-70 family RNA polymerase sigma factor [[Clostridium] fimetarium]SEV81722.1 RNA polymerase primary sigma factor [[Clostridium] fimetarium]